MQHFIPNHDAQLLADSDGSPVYELDYTLPSDKNLTDPYWKPTERGVARAYIVAHLEQINGEHDADSARRCAAVDLDTDLDVDQWATLASVAGNLSSEVDVARAEDLIDDLLADLGYDRKAARK